MSGSVNKVILIGNLGRDPEVRRLNSGDPVVNFSLATTETYKGRDGNKKEETQWHSCVAWGKLAEIIGEYVNKGSPLYVEGAIKYGKYTDSAGIEKYSTDIKVDEMRLLAGKPDGQHRQPDQRREPAPPQQPIDDVPFDDDIPFDGGH